MDGYALRAEDLSQPGSTLTLVGQALAGHSFQGELKPGECIRIMTGAQVSASASAVIPQEDTEVQADSPKTYSFSSERQSRPEHSPPR